MDTEEKVTWYSKIVNFCNSHPKTCFASRLVLWALLAGILPFIFIAWRYGIFTAEPKIKLTGWGIIAIILAIIFIITLVKYIYKSLTPGLVKQCVSGLFSITLPLIIFYLFIRSIENSLKLLEQVLFVLIILETIAIPVNPFPSYIAKKNAELGMEKYERATDLLWDKFFKKKKEEDK